MGTLYDIDGKVVAISDDFGVTDYGLFTDNDGNSARQATLTYQGKKLYPKNYPAQHGDIVKDYESGYMIALGDSYTSMAATYFREFGKRHGLMCDNRGLASSTIAGSADGTTVGYHAFWVRLDEAVAEYKASGTCDDVKLITFMGGANDWHTVDEEKGIDRLGNIDSTNKEQLYGACKYIFSTLLATFPNADIVVILQPSSPSKGNAVMRKKEAIVREVAEMYGLPICDCIFEWYNPDNPTDAATYWASDDLHMSDKGNEAIFAKLEKVVNNLPFTRS